MLINHFKVWTGSYVQQNLIFYGIFDIIKWAIQHAYESNNVT